MASGRRAAVIRHRYLVWPIVLGVWLSGALWLVFHDFLMRPGEFGLTAHPLEQWWLRAHGAFAFASLWLLGFLSVAHVGGRWAWRRQRRSGPVSYTHLDVYKRQMHRRSNTPHSRRHSASSRAARPAASFGTAAPRASRRRLRSPSSPLLRWPIRMPPRSSHGCRRRPRRLRSS